MQLETENQFFENVPVLHLYSQSVMLRMLVGVFHGILQMIEETSHQCRAAVQRPNRSAHRMLGAVMVRVIVTHVPHEVRGRTAHFAVRLQRRRQ